MCTCLSNPTPHIRKMQHWPHPNFWLLNSQLNSSSKDLYQLDYTFVRTRVAMSHLYIRTSFSCKRMSPLYINYQLDLSSKTLNLSKRSIWIYKHTHSWWIFRFFCLSRPPVGWQKGRQKKQKLPKNTKNSRNEKFSTTATENVCLNDAYTVNLKKIPEIDIHNHWKFMQSFVIWHSAQFLIIATLPLYSNYVI